ncbi:MAG: class I mannose-6-phosphate isomerase [Gemmatimonadetes bacterium]|nr:class I mannose-6-phosphate isomerase [Gemmatimonadota bacterium]
MASSHVGLRAPLTFTPLLKDYLWGGDRLVRLLGRNLPDGAIAESWEISGYPGTASVVDGGPLKGRDLPGLVADYGVDLVGRRGRWAVERGMFPLLIKLLDASHALSVQVHPDDEYAAAHHPGEVGKTEMWYILHAEAGARIIHGLSPGIDRAALRRAVSEGRLQDCLNRVAVRPGDSVLVPAGTVHGILSGIVLVEVQQSSDRTYRIHDWDRVGPDGAPRPLHLDRALDVIDFKSVPALVEPRLAAAGGGWRREVVAECDDFVVERVGVEAGAVFEADLDGETFEAWGVLSGSASLLTAHDRAMHMEVARFALLPATMGPFALRAATDVVALRAYLP